MDYEDDYDVHMEDDEGYYSDGSYNGSDDCIVEDNDRALGDENCKFDDDDDEDFVTAAMVAKNRYSVLEESDIKREQEDDITSVSSVLSVSRVASSILLRHYKWSVSEAKSAWFDDEDKVRETVGLLKNPVVASANKLRRGRKEVTCVICFDTFPRGSIKLKSAACGHPFCTTCWEGYIRTSINDGPGCLMLRCPIPSCVAAIGEDMVSELVSEADNQKYTRYLVRSYIQTKPWTKWCPAPGCEMAINFNGDRENYHVRCPCSLEFCWNCTEDAHRPVDCSTVEKWIVKNSAESENTTWILANSKQCPKCRRPIEKNDGCMHMTCTPPCKFQFCWLCLGDWSEHGSSTGGYYACNRYEAAKRQGVYDEAEKIRETAKNSLERYAHYYERWAGNHTSREKALEDLRQTETVKEKLNHIQQVNNLAWLEFITKSWQQIVECRRVLKWTYAYGYYLPEKEHAKKQLFEYYQAEAEKALENLHHCAEKELQPFLGEEGGGGKLKEEFKLFQQKLSGLTMTTKNQFDTLVNNLDYNLSSCDTEAAAVV